MFLSWRSVRRLRARTRPGSRPQVEQLEDRCLLSAGPSSTEAVLFDESLHAQLGLRSGVLKSWTAKFYGEHTLPWARLWSVIVYLYWGKRNNVTG